MIYSYFIEYVVEPYDKPRQIWGTVVSVHYQVNENNYGLFVYDCMKKLVEPNKGTGFSICDLKFLGSEPDKDE